MAPHRLSEEQGGSPSPRPPSCPSLCFPPHAARPGRGRRVFPAPSWASAPSPPAGAASIRGARPLPAALAVLQARSRPVSPDLALGFQTGASPPSRQAPPPRVSLSDPPCRDGSLGGSQTFASLLEAGRHPPPTRPCGTVLPIRFKRPCGHPGGVGACPLPPCLFANTLCPSSLT